MHKESLSQMYREYQEQGGEESAIGPSAPIRTISGISKGTEIARKQQCLEIKEAAAAAAPSFQGDMESTTEKSESDGDLQTHSVSEQTTEEDRETEQDLKAMPNSEFSPEPEAINPSVSEISSGLAEAIEDSLSKPQELTEETVAASLEIETTSEAETTASPEGVEKLTVEMEDEDDFVDLKEESSVPLPSEEFAETDKKHSSNENQVTKEEEVIEKQSESVLLKYQDNVGMNGKKEELALSETTNSAAQEVATQLDSEGKKKLEEKTVPSEKTAEKGNAHAAEPAGASEKRIAKLDVSSVASDTERLELRASTCLEAPLPARSIPEVTSTCFLCA